MCTDCHFLAIQRWLNTTPNWMRFDKEHESYHSPNQICWIPQCNMLKVNNKNCWSCGLWIVNWECASDCAWLVAKQKRPLRLFFGLGPSHQRQLTCFQTTFFVAATTTIQTIRTATDGWTGWVTDSLSDSPTDWLTDRMNDWLTEWKTVFSLVDESAQ